MFKECTPPIPVARLIGCIGFDDAVGSVKAAASNDIQEITFLGGCLMWNDADVYGGRIWLNFFVSVCSDLWKYLERESTMMFSVPLMCFEYRDVSLLTSIHRSQHTTALWDSAFTGSKDMLCIQSSALELSVNAKMCDLCPIFRMLMYMVTADASNLRRFNMSFPCHAAGIIHRHARPFFCIPQCHIHRRLTIALLMV